jgi:cellulose synthase/poly-beta-1,6-N-acetylglucosamine synthase-like glycosyltransferase
MLTLSVTFLAPAMTAIASYWLYAVAAVGAKRGGPVVDCCAADHSFVIVIPAHDEEGTIGAAIRSCRSVEYPEDRVSILVVADNCSDRTAGVAREGGATCVERHDQEKRGKGFALEFAFGQLAEFAPDAVLVLDADCSVDRATFRVLDAYLREGYQVLQLADIAANPDASPIAYALSVGNVIENDLFWAGRAALGKSVALRGTGMVFRRDVLDLVPWRAFTAAEDAEYTQALARAGIRTCLVPEAAVRSAFPATIAQMRIQRVRWAAGTSSLSRRLCTRSLRAGSWSQRWAGLDAAWIHFMGSRPLVVACLCAGGVCAFAGGTAVKVGLAAGLAHGSCWLGAALLGYLGLGVVRLGLSWRRVGMLLASPLVLLVLVAIAVGTAVSARSLEWRRTPR